MIYFSCPGCQRLGEAADRMAGDVVTCPNCLMQMQVPHASTATPAADSKTLLFQAPPDDGKIRFLCPRCRRRQRAAKDAAGSVTVCRRCRQRMYVPAVGSGGGPLVLASRLKEPQKEPSAYYYVKNGQQCGPVPAGLLRKMAKTGVLLPDDLIWKKGMTNWIPASRLHGLFPGLKSPPPVPATPPPAASPGVAPGSALAALPAQHEAPTRLAATEVASLIARGMGCAEKGDATSALADLNEAIRIDPRNAQAYASRAVVYAQLKGDHRRAIADLTEAIRIAPTEAVLHEFRGLFYKAIGETGKAAEDERRAAELAKRGPSQIIIKLG